MIPGEVQRQLHDRLERIQHLMDALAKARGDFAEQQEIAERIHREITAAKLAVRPFGPDDTAA